LPASETDLEVDVEEAVIEEALGGLSDSKCSKWNWILMFRPRDTYVC
jgi:hypothetical protein